MSPRVAITGAAGLLGRELVDVFAGAQYDVNPLTRPRFDITRDTDVRRLVGWQPEVVINAAAWTDVDGCARDPARAMQINGHAAGAVAEVAATAGAIAVQISTNEVFDGSIDRPYTEDDEPNPINPYGVAKLAGEQLVGGASPRHLIVRTAWLYGASGGFPTKIHAAAKRAMADGRPLRVVVDEWGNPTSVRWLADAIRELVDLTLRGRAGYGRYHLAGWPPTTRFEWARQLLGTDVGLEPISLADFTRDSRVPPRAVLDVTRAAALGIEPHSWETDLPHG